MIYTHKMFLFKELIELMVKGHTGNISTLFCMHVELYIFLQKLRVASHQRKTMKTVLRPEKSKDVVTAWSK